MSDPDDEALKAKVMLLTKPGQTYTSRKLSHLIAPKTKRCENRRALSRRIAEVMRRSGKFREFQRKNRSVVMERIA